MPDLIIVEHKLYDPTVGRYDELVGALRRAEDYQHDPEQIKRLLENESTRYFLGFLGGHAVGSTVLVGLFPTSTKNVALLEDVAVLPEARRLGVGRRLVQHAEDTAIMLGADAIQLHSNPDFRPEANAMYADMGYTIHHTNVFVKDLASPDNA